MVAAINCGGDEYTDSNGITFDNDKYFSGGTSSDHGINYRIRNTDDEILYQTERWSSDTLTYSIPLKSNINGKYVLNLKFSEVYFTNKGDKVFNVALGRETVIKNLDIYNKVGKAYALDEYIEFEIRNKHSSIGQNKMERIQKFRMCRNGIAIVLVFQSRNCRKL